MTLREQVFRKMGWEPEHHRDDLYRWVKDGVRLNSIVATKQEIGDEVMFPPIDEQWEVCAKYLVSFMRERNYRMSVNYREYSNRKKDCYEFCWYQLHDTEKSEMLLLYSEYMDVPRNKMSCEFIGLSKNIAEAACKAFLGVEL